MNKVRQASSLVFVGISLCGLISCDSGAAIPDASGRGTTAITTSMEKVSSAEETFGEENVVKVEVQWDKTNYVSGLQLGATQTHYFWERGDAQAVSRVENIMRSFASIHNQHIMGWGGDNPWPSKTAAMDFTSLDTRMAYIRTLGGEQMMTFCQAPGWMKGTDDWAMENAVLDEYVDDFAYLCAQIASRYPDVKYFQVWNEFKGYWNQQKNRWDYERYTILYNAVYQAVKKVRPDAKIGGFYMVLCGDGSQELFGVKGTHAEAPLDKTAREGLQYWLEHKVSADFVCIDKGLRDFHNKSFEPTAEQTLQLASMFEKAIAEICSVTDLPIVLSEYYGYTVRSGGEPNEAVDAAQYAAIYYYLLQGARERNLTALLWIEKQESVPGSLFTDTQKDGGQARAHAQVAEQITQHFSKGKPIVDASVSSHDVLAMASDTTLMLINIRNRSVLVSVNNEPALQLQPFEVRFVALS